MHQVRPLLLALALVACERSRALDYVDDVSADGAIRKDMSSVADAASRDLTGTAGPSGLLLHYSFEGVGPSSTVVEDLSGHGRHGSFGGTAPTAFGVKGDGLDCRSASVLAPDNPVGGLRAFTISLWFKHPDPTENLKLASAAWWQGGTNASGWVLGTHAAEFWADGGKVWGPDIVNHDNAFPRDQWTQEVITYDGQSVREYTDTRLINDWPTYGLPVGQGKPMTVCGWPSVGFRYTGLIDEVRLFDRALSGQEINDLFRLDHGY